MGVTGGEPESFPGVRRRFGEGRSCKGGCVRARRRPRPRDQRPDGLTQVADGVIVGTRIVDFIDQNRDDADVGSKVAAMVSELVPQ